MQRRTTKSRPKYRSHPSERPIERDTMPLSDGPRVVGAMSDRMEAALLILKGDPA